MPLPVIPDVFRTALHWVTTSGLDAVNVLHFYSSTGDPAGLAAALDSNLTSEMWDSVTTEARIDLVSITPLDGISATYNYSPPLTSQWDGSNGTDYSPAVAALILLDTALRGPRNRGKIFLPFTAESISDSGLLSPAVTAEAQTHWTNFLGNMLADGYGLVVASYVGSDAHNVVAARVQQVLATQKRRQNQLR